MLKKLLNPFGIRITEAGKAFTWLGMLTAAIAHVVFYVTVIHFIVKAW